MIYATYNTSKKILVEKQFYVREKQEYEKDKLLNFITINNIYPNDKNNNSNKKYPMDKGKYIASFKAMRDYLYDTYYFIYKNKIYSFEEELFKNSNLFLYEENGNLTIDYKGYKQDRTLLPVYGELEINKNGNQSTFSNITADFWKFNNLPLSFQEIRIIKTREDLKGSILSEETLYSGFLEHAEIKRSQEEEQNIKLNLISPMNLATKKYVTIVGNYNSDNLFYEIFAPLIEDGYKIRTIEIEKRKITVDYYLETIETIMNDLSHKLNLFWQIDENKNIYIRSIEKMLNKNAVLTINTRDYNTVPKGLYDLTPIIENNNYFNCINAKNLRMYQSANDDSIINSMKLVIDDTAEFENPIDFGLRGAERVCLNNQEDEITILRIETSNNVICDIKYNVIAKKIVLPRGWVYDDDDTENAVAILQRDQFFKNLITGITWKKETTTIKSINTDTLLKYEIYRVTNSDEIFKCEGKVNESGIVETGLDLSGKWFTNYELIEYCDSLIKPNVNEVSNVRIGFDYNHNLKIGDKISIDDFDMNFEGSFIITEITETFKEKCNYDCQIIAQNNKMLSNYIDIFRKPLKEEADKDYSSVNLIEYSNEEINETYERIEI